MKNVIYSFRRFAIPLLFCLSGILLAASSFSAHAYLKGIPLPDECPEGSVDVNANSGCRPLKPSSIIGAGSVWTNRLWGGSALSGFEQYVPFSGQWFMNTYFCDASRTSVCSVGQAEGSVRSVHGVTLTTDKVVVRQNADFGGGAGNTIHHAIRLCYTLEDSYGQEWSSSDYELTCQDAQPLLPNPPICTINGTSPLNVDMGTLESGKIATVADVSQAQKKTIDIKCNGKGALNGDISFKFTAVSVSGNNVIRTSDPALGVALFYENQLAEASKNYSITVPQGGSKITLGFQAIKDNSKTLTGGEFTADAVMILTEK